MFIRGYPIIKQKVENQRNLCCIPYLDSVFLTILNIFFLSFDSEIEQDLMDSVLYFAVDYSNGVLADIEICYAFVFLVKLSEVFQEIQPKITMIITGFRDQWFKGRQICKSYISTFNVQTVFSRCSQLEQKLRAKQIMLFDRDLFG